MLDAQKTIHVAHECVGQDLSRSMENKCKFEVCKGADIKLLANQHFV